MDRISESCTDCKKTARDSSATVWEMASEDGVNTSITDVTGTNSAGSFEGCVHLHVQASAFISD